ncbi:hypothetical protein BS78_09G239200 [Paspalum vaginatum]|nr:hypothetical protein BS78_09G239200 [Paspalum vaginatum]
MTVNATTANTTQIRYEPGKASFLLLSWLPSPLCLRALWNRSTVLIQIVGAPDFPFSRLFYLRQLGSYLSSPHAVAALLGYTPERTERSQARIEKERGRPSSPSQPFFLSRRCWRSIVSCPFSGSGGGGVRSEKQQLIWYLTGRTNCQHGRNPQGQKRRYSGPDLPEDILCLIHFLMALRDAARTACVSHAFLCSWRCRPDITFSRATLGLNKNFAWKG